MSHLAEESSLRIAVLNGPSLSSTVADTKMDSADGMRTNAKGKLLPMRIVIQLLLDISLCSTNCARRLAAVKRIQNTVE